MTLACDGCGSDLPTDPRHAVEEDELDEVVAHIKDGDEPYIVCETLYYCGPDCIVDAAGGDA